MSLYTMDKNTKGILAWERRMMDKLGVCGAVLCECLAWRSGEEGEESPSDGAVELALKWEGDPQQFYAAIQESNRWCLAPTLGCIQGCEIWKDFSVMEYQGAKPMRKATEEFIEAAYEMTTTLPIFGFAVGLTALIGIIVLTYQILPR